MAIITPDAHRRFVIGGDVQANEIGQAYMAHITHALRLEHLQEIGNWLTFDLLQNHLLLSSAKHLWHLNKGGDIHAFNTVDGRGKTLGTPIVSGGYDRSGKTTTVLNRCLSCMGGCVCTFLVPIRGVYREPDLKAYMEKRYPTVPVHNFTKQEKVKRFVHLTLYEEYTG